ncbi:MAG: hypothetical protein R2867_14090 [Caldilineaceae bacterium]
MSTASTAHSIQLMADELLADVHPLRELFDELVDNVRALLLQEGVAEPEIEAALDLRYQGGRYELTMPVTLEVESSAICLTDPLPLDRAALQDAVAAFQRAHEERYGYILGTEMVQVVTLRVKGSG